MKQPTILSHYILAFGFILLNFVSCSVFDDAPTPVMARYDLPSEVLDSIFTSDIPKAIRNVDNFLDKIKRNGMVIHEGNDPPEITADGSDDVGKKYIIEHDCIFDEQAPANVDSLYGKYEETIRIFPNPPNNLMADVSYSSVGDDDYPLFHSGMDRGSGRGYVSGNGNNFTIFYKVEGGKGNFNNIPYQAIWIVSGTVSDTENARNITNVTKCLVMLQKGDDPKDQVANRGTIRIFRDDNPDWIQPEVVISDFSPTEGTYNTEVTINGSGFGTQNDSLIVLFNAKIAEVLKRDPSQLLVKVPQGAGTGPVTVRVNDKTGTGGDFTYIPEEVVISDFSPTEGPYDTEVTINGSGFGTVNDTLTVLFNGTEAEVLKRDANQLLVIFPQGAGTGPLTVQVNDQTGTGGVFTYIQEEVVISDFSPTEGPYDTEVTINGSGFGTENDSLTVLFNGVIAEVLKRSATQLLVKVPQGAGTGPVSVRVNDQIGTGGDFTYIPDAPDLVVTSIELTEPATINKENSVEVPISVTVLNSGTADADVFKTSINFIGPDTPEDGFVVAFTVPGQSDIWYPWTQNSLAPGSEVSFKGILTFNSSRQGMTVSVYAVADSCSGDEFVPVYCRVLESNEENNNSSAISLKLPEIGPVLITGTPGAID